MNAPVAQSQRIDSAIRTQTMRNGFVQGLFWAVMFGAGESSFPIFATHIHAPGFVFGLMTGLPSILGPIAQLFGADVVERTKNRKRLVNVSVVIQALSFAPLVLIPFLHAGSSSYVLLLSIILAYFISGHFCTPAWNSWISVVVPSQERGRYFANCARAVGFISLVVKLAIGALLYFAGQQPTEEARNIWIAVIFSAAFLISGITRLVSFLFIRKMHEPRFEHSPDATFTFWQFIRRAPESNFVRFSLFVALVNFGANIAGPYFLPYAVYTLGFAQWQWIILDSAAGVSAVATLLFWGTFSHRFGNKKTLQYTALAVTTIPILWMTSVNFYYLTGVNTLSGIAWAGFNLSSFNYLLEAVSPPKRARCAAYFSFLTGIGIFVGSMAGGWLNEALPPTLTWGTWSLTVSSPFIYLLVLSAVVRFAMALFSLRAFRELRDVQPLGLRDIVFYISELRAPVGLRFDTVDDSSDEDPLN